MMSSRLCQRFCIGVTVMLAYACVVVPPPATGVPANPKTLTDWQFRGRIAVSSVEGSWQGRLNWQQAKEQFSARIDGPIGVGRVSIEGDPSLVVLRLSKDDTRVISDPQQWLQTEMGWSAPIEHVPFWLIGVPDPNTAVDDIGSVLALHASNEYFQRFIQSGWQVYYPEHQVSAGIWLPRMVILSRQSNAGSGDVFQGDEIRLRIDEWVMPERSESSI
ncbi:MAG: outer membrane lipoprotein LolB [Gammaproteobacteria bacterium]|nr:outer membrane lipoprotein LolB [Gammaproteobacteria bacterium]